MPNRRKIRKFILKILRQVEQASSEIGTESELNEPSSSVSQGTLSSAENDIYAKVEALKQKRAIVPSTLEESLDNEMERYEQSDVKGPLLEKMLLITKTLRPTTCDCERAFSVAGYFCSRLRSKLDDESLNTLCFLKSYFKNHYQN